MNEGTCLNEIIWKWNKDNTSSLAFDDSCNYAGKFSVMCKYNVNTKGDLCIHGEIDHTLTLDRDIPDNIEDFIISLQRTVPLEIFDPVDIVMTTKVRFEC